MKVKPILTLGAILLLFLCGLLVYNLSSIKTLYYKFSGTSGVVRTKISDNVFLEYEYRGGRLYGKQTLAEGQVEGWAYRYHRNGKIERKLYVDNITNHYKEYAFFESGRLKYVGNYFNLKKYGGWNFYEDGRLSRYKIFDIDGKEYFNADYDGQGNLVNQKGLIVSEHLYSVNSENKIVVMSNSSKLDYEDIKDLVITVAVPEKTRLQVSVTINNLKCDVSKVVNSTVKVKNAFMIKGVYEIFIETHLLDKKNTVINGINMKRRIIKI